MGDSFTIYSFFSLLGCLCTGLIVAWLLYGRTSALSKPLRIGLAALRALSVTLILWLLFSPLIKNISYTLEKPVVVIAQDNSQSAGTFTAAGFDRQKYERDLLRLRKTLSEKYDVRAYSFSDQVTEGLDFGYKGKLTNASALAAKLNDELMNKNVGGIILATDGIFNRGGNATELSNLRAPVYTIALGDTVPKKDILISNLNYNELVYLDNDFKLEIQVQAYQCQGEQTVLKVMEDGKLVHEEKLNLNTGLFSKDIAVQLKATTVGKHQYTVSVSDVAGALSAKNNSRTALVEVIDGRQKILIAADGPHPDIAALRSAISLNKHHEVTVALNEELSKLQPESYALVILYQLPGMVAGQKGFLERIQKAKVPVWYIIGAQTQTGQFNQIQHGVNFSPDNGPLDHTYSDAGQNFSAFDLDEVSKKAIANFDPLQSPSGRLNLAGAVQTVLNQRTGKITSDRPQLFFMNDNGRKVGYLMGEGLWKWKFSEARAGKDTPVFNDLIGKVVQYLSVKDDKRKFRVYPVKHIFDENEPVQLNALLYNDSYAAVNTPDVTIDIRNEKGKSYPYTFSRAESAYQLDAGILPPGNYTYTANTILAARKYQVKGSFIIRVLDAEFQQTIANHHLLYQLSAQTNGKLFSPAELLLIEKELSNSGQMKTLSYEDRKYEELVNLKWLFVLILILLSAEWFTRKRNAAL